MDSLQTRDVVLLGDRRWQLHRLDRLGVDHLPFTLKVLLENLLRHEDGQLVTVEQVEAVRRWDPTAERRDEVDLHPTRVFLHDTNGVPALVDLAAMRDALAGLGGDPQAVNPLIPAELVADHSVIADVFGRRDARDRNVELEYAPNSERYRFLKWGQAALDKFKIVPPAWGSCTRSTSSTWPGWWRPTATESTRMCAWHRLAHHHGQRPGRARLGNRRHRGRGGHVGAVAVPGRAAGGGLPAHRRAAAGGYRHRPGAHHHRAAAPPRGGGQVRRVPRSRGDRDQRGRSGDDRQHEPEFGSTCAVFPIDAQTLRYLRFTGRRPEHVALVEAYAKQQGLWHEPDMQLTYSEQVELSLSSVVASLAGSRRPQDRVPLTAAQAAFRAELGGPPERAHRPATWWTRRPRNPSRPATPRPSSPTSGRTLHRRATTAPMRPLPWSPDRRSRWCWRASGTGSATERWPSPPSPPAPTPPTHR